MASEATAEEQKFENKVSCKITKIFSKSRAYPKPKRWKHFSDWESYFSRKEHITKLDIKSIDGNLKKGETPKNQMLLQEERWTV